MADIKGNYRIQFLKCIYLNITTNNKADYTGLMLGLQLLNEHRQGTPYKKLLIIGVSKLVLNQIQRIQRVRDTEL